MGFAIETIDLTKRFLQAKGYGDLVYHPFQRKEVLALERVSIQVEEGELFGLLGPNGAGKTTLIKILCTLILPDAGQAYVHGYNVAKNGREIRRAIGYVVSDERSFSWRLTGRQNLIFFATLNNLSRAEAQGRVKDVLQQVELEDHADRMFKDYSTGMRQRLSIARGLITNPGILLVDEPTKSLDPIAAHKLREFLRNKLVLEDGKTVFLATHNLEEAEHLCDRLAIIDQGKIRLCGSLGQIRKALNSGGQRYILKLINNGAGRLPIMQSLRELKSIRNLSVQDRAGELLLSLELEDNTDLIPQIVERVTRQGGQIAAIYPEEKSLQEIFSGMGI